MEVLFLTLIWSKLIDNWFSFLGPSDIEGSLALSGTLLVVASNVKFFKNSNDAICCEECAKLI